MHNLNKYVSIYKEQLQKGDILIAYNELTKFLLSLRTDCIQAFSDLYSFGGMLNAYLDYSYFYYSNSFLKSKKLKFGLVLNHLEMRVELWLLGNTKIVQKKYWDLLKHSKWNKDQNQMPTYAILESILVEQPDFNHLNELAEQIIKQMELQSDDIIETLKTLD